MWLKNEKNENKESEKYSSIHVNFLHFTQLLFSSIDKCLNKAVSNLSVLQVIMQQSWMRQDLLQFFTSLF